MEQTEKKEKKQPLSELMETTLAKVHEMVDSNTIIGEPITTPDGVTVIPVSRVSFGFGTGGSDYGKTVPKFGGVGAAGVKIDPVSFLIIKDGVTRVVPVATPTVGPVDRMIEMVPELIEKIDGLSARKKETDMFDS